MSQTEEQQAIEATFEFVENEPIEATFQISTQVQDLNYIHYQDVPSDTWTITHNLDKYPSVTVVTSAGDVIATDCTYIDTNTVEVYFNGAFAGRAYIN